MNSLRVLLIEDNPADAAIARDLLEGFVGEISVASRLADALPHVGSADVAVLDFGLPDADGLHGIRRLLIEQPTLPIVVLTGNRDEEQAMAALQAGAQDVLLKGEVTALSLRRAIGYALERQQLQERFEASVDELERQRQSVMQLNQLKNDLIAVLAHDIKGPLTSIVGFAELLEEGYLEGDAATDAARTIRNNAQRLATLANDVLALSRVEHGALEIAEDRVDLVTVLAETVELHAGERTIDFTRRPDRAIVSGDADRLKQVFDNLLRNAIKYSPGGEPVDVWIDSDGDRYRVCIRDRGIGIPADELEKLFDRFTRGSNARKAKIAGTGIGLFVVKTIVERHGGSVAVRSELGEGTTVDVLFPSIDASAEHRPARVTVFTSDTSLRRFIAYELRSRGMRVREPVTLEEALRTLERGDALLVDEDTARYDDVKAVQSLGVRAIGMGDRDAGWDARLSRPFLVNDLLRALDARLIQA